MASTIFSYRCARCGHIGQMEKTTSDVLCVQCRAAVPLIEGAAIRFYDGKTEQNEYFDEIYSEKTDQHDYFVKIYGSPPATQDGASAKREHALYDSLAKQAKAFVELSGRSLEQDFVNLDILELACGSGWVTGALLRSPTVKDCRFHAFDISSGGPLLLSRFAEHIGRAEALELSVQDACQLQFADGSFDLLLGNSILHHFNDVGSCLRECHRIMRPGASAIFGEPFAFGHVLVASAMKAASLIVGRNNPRINGYYGNIAFKVQNNNDASALEHLVDKHVFLRETLLDICRASGFTDVTIKPRHDYAFFKSGLAVDVAMRKIAVEDEEIAREGRRIYKVIAEMFSERTFAHALPNFMDVILRK